jgi:glycosyltransferase involved in cell wall biosynthesis
LHSAPAKENNKQQYHTKTRLPVVKKILIVDNSSWNIYNFRLPLVKRLKSDGYEVTVATPVDEYIQYLNKTHFNRHIQLKHLSRQGKNPFQDLAFLAELLRIYRKVRPDAVIHFTIKPNIYGSLAARFFKIPAISVMTGLGYTFVHQSGSNRLAPMMMKMAFKKLKKLVVYNRDDKQELIKQKITAEARCVFVPGDGVDTNYYRPMEVKAPRQPFLFLFIGRLLEDKGVREYVAAAKKIRSAHPGTECWIVGDLNFGNPSDITKSQLLEWIENQDIRYFATTKDVRQYIRQCNVLVLPSYREGLPRVILEAMSMGKPIITTDVAGCREAVVHPENGLIVPVRDADSLAEAMLHYRNSPPEELSRIGERNRKRVLELYTVEKSTDAFIHLICEITGSKARKKVAQNTPAK